MRRSPNKTIPADSVLRTLWDDPPSQYASDLIHATITSISKNVDAYPFTLKQRSRRSPTKLTAFPIHEDIVVITKNISTHPFTITQPSWRAPSTTKNNIYHSRNQFSERQVSVHCAPPFHSTQTLRRPPSCKKHTLFVSDTRRRTSSSTMPEHKPVKRVLTGAT